MRGTVLYPLNQLKALYPDVYTREQAKYDGRETVLDFRIPYLGLLWNDVLHSAALHPYLLHSALCSAGFNDRLSRNQEFFQIPVEALRERGCVYYRNESFWLNNAPYEDVPPLPPEDEFEPFDTSTYRELAEAPQRYVDYLRRQQQSGKRVLLFAQIPHILIPGPIDVSNMEVVRYDRPPNGLH